MAKKAAMPSPDAVATEMKRVKQTALELAVLALMTSDAYADLYDAAYRKSGNGEGTSVNRPGAPLGDPTGDVATSGMHNKMRWRVRQAARPLRRIDPILVQSVKIIAEAWAEQDPDMREKLNRLTELEKEIAEQTDRGLSAHRSKGLTG